MGNPYAPPGAGDRSGDGSGDAGNRPGAGPAEPAVPRERVPRTDRAHRPERPPPDPAGARRLAGLVLRFALLMLASLLVSRLPLPWGAAAPLLTLAALAVGVAALVQGVRARVRASSHVLVGLGLGLGVVVLLQQALVVALWPITVQLQECRDAALTIAADDACQADYERRIRDLTRLPTPAG